MKCAECIIEKPKQDWTSFHRMPVGVIFTLQIFLFGTGNGLFLVYIKARKQNLQLVFES